MKNGSKYREAVAARAAEVTAQLCSARERQATAAARKQPMLDMVSSCDIVWLLSQQSSVYLIIAW